MPQYDKEPEMFDVEVKDETEKAWLLVIDGEEKWVPKSIGQLEHHGESVDDVLVVPNWWAVKEGLA